MCPVFHTLWCCAAFRSRSFGQTFIDRKTCHLNSSHVVILFCKARHFTVLCHSGEQEAVLLGVLEHLPTARHPLFSLAHCRHPPSSSHCHHRSKEQRSHTRNKNLFANLVLTLDCSKTEKKELQFGLKTLKCNGIFFLL